MPNPEISHSRDQRVSKESPGLTQSVQFDPTSGLVWNQFKIQFVQFPTGPFLGDLGWFRFRSLAVEFKVVACCASKQKLYVHNSGRHGRRVDTAIHVDGR